jgi:hypothetical protein
MGVGNSVVVLRDEHDVLCLMIDSEFEGSRKDSFFQ